MPGSLQRAHGPLAQGSVLMHLHIGLLNHDRPPQRAAQALAVLVLGFVGRPSRRPVGLGSCSVRGRGRSGSLLLVKNALQVLRPLQVLFELQEAITDFPYMFLLPRSDRAQRGASKSSPGVLVPCTYLCGDCFLGSRVFFILEVSAEIF